MKALVLSGGGSHGAYQLGVLKHLMVDQGLDYDIVAGVSVGAINSSILAQFAKGDPVGSWGKLKSVWEQVSTKKVRKKWFLFGALASVWKPSVYNSAPLHDWVKGGLQPDLVKNSGRLLRIVAVSMTTGESRVVDETTDNLSDWVLASSAYPVMFLPVSIEGERWVDGGVRNVTPLGEVIRAGSDDIDVIMCSDPDLANPYPPKGKQRAMPDYALRCLDIVTNQVMRADLKICGLKNDLAGPFKQVNLRVIKPKFNLDSVMSSLDFDQSGVQKITDIGYKDALEL
jgi:NTE family protein